MGEMDDLDEDLFNLMQEGEMVGLASPTQWM